MAGLPENTAPLVAWNTTVFILRWTSSYRFLLEKRHDGLLIKMTDLISIEAIPVYENISPIKGQSFDMVFDINPRKDFMKACC